MPRFALDWFGFAATFAISCALFTLFPFTACTLWFSFTKMIVPLMSAYFSIAAYGHYFFLLKRLIARIH